jgi:hypothetical protein
VNNTNSIEKIVKDMNGEIVRYRLLLTIYSKFKHINWYEENEQLKLEIQKLKEQNSMLICEMAIMVAHSKRR